MGVNTQTTQAAMTNDLPANCTVNNEFGFIVSSIYAVASLLTLFALC